MSELVLSTMAVLQSRDTTRCDSRERRRATPREEHRAARLCRSWRAGLSGAPLPPPQPRCAFSISLSPHSESNHLAYQNRALSLFFMQRPRRPTTPFIFANSQSDTTTALLGDFPFDFGATQKSGRTMPTKKRRSLAHPPTPAPPNLSADVFSTVHWG